MERKIIFHIISDVEKYIIELPEYDTVGCLKKVIFKKIRIPKSEQVITGWKQPPSDDQDILQLCSDNDIANILYVRKCKQIKNIEKTSLKTSLNEVLELKACENFIIEVTNNISDISGLLFHNDLLKNKINELCMAPLEKRKVLLLYLHNKQHPFSNIFWRNIRKTNVREIISKKFCVVGWDLTDSTYQHALIDALKTNELDHIVRYVEQNIGAAMCLTSANDRKGVEIFCCMTENISDQDFFNCLDISSKTQYKKEVVNSIVVQQNFADSLGGRDYDSYEYDEHQYLKNNIGYAIAGPPIHESGYSDEVKKEIEKLYKKILDKNNEVAHYKDKVEIAIIYNCTEPLPNVKKAKMKKNPEYIPDEDIMPLPVFILRKCHGSENPCRIFIDHIGRVYNTWKEYLSENKLLECVMVFPKNGRYEVDENEKVILQKDYSPSCSTATKVLNGLDIAGAVTGVASGGVGVTTAVLSGTAIAASSPILAVALPVAGIAAVATGAVVGVYSIVRSSMTIHDRVQREESVNFFKSTEARGAYMNIVAGSLGFIGAGTNVVFSQLISNGVKIGTGAKVAVNAVNIINLGVGGASMANSIHDIISQWVNSKEPPSALTILQLSSNILFFGHAVFNFKTATTIIDETQARVLQDYNDNLRSNRHRKSFNKILKETIRKNDGNSVQGKSEVITALRNIQNKDETFAALTRNFPKMNKKGIKVFTKDGQIQFDGVAIDMAEFCTIKASEVNSFLTHLPVNNKVNAVELSSVGNIFKLNGINLTNMTELVTYASKLISFYNSDVKEKIISTLAKVLSSFSKPILKSLAEMLPKTWHLEVLQRVLNFFSLIAADLENKYKKWKNSNSQEDFLPIFDHVNCAHFDKVKRYVKFMEEAVLICYEINHMPEKVFERLIKYCYEWVYTKFNDYLEDEERKKKREIHSAQMRFTPLEIDCKICGGKYYKIDK